MIEKEVRYGSSRELASRAVLLDLGKQLLQLGLLKVLAHRLQHAATQWVCGFVSTRLCFEVVVQRGWGAGGGGQGNSVRIDLRLEGVLEVTRVQCTRQVVSLHLLHRSVHPVHHTPCTATGKHSTGSRKGAVTPLLGVHQPTPYLGPPSLSRRRSSNWPFLANTMCRTQSMMGFWLMAPGSSAGGQKAFLIFEFTSACRQANKQTSEQASKQSVQVQKQTGEHGRGECGGVLGSAAAVVAHHRVVHEDGAAWDTLAHLLGALWATLQAHEHVMAKDDRLELPLDLAEREGARASTG